MPKLSLPEYTQEQALSRILNYLRNPAQRNPDYYNYGNDLYIPSLISECLSGEVKAQWDRDNPRVGLSTTFEHDIKTNSNSFYEAAWSLCAREILRPGVIYPPQNQQNQQIGIIGAGFSLTPYGKQWLEETSGYECIPSEYGRFSQLLAGHSHRFTNAYHVRSQEAIRCYRAHAYLACCVMCGAASESILLALAIAKKGDEQFILKEYAATKGRTTIQNFLLTNQNGYVCRELPNYTDSLKYWRDTAAHGADTNISESEAFSSLLFLLRFAQFADEGWDNLTVSNP